MTSQPEKQTIAIHTSPNISRSKGLFYFLEKSYTKCAEETIPRPFPKNPKLDTSLDQYFDILYILFLLYAKLRAIEVC